jgi:hypothetical protein
MSSRKPPHAAHPTEAVPSMPAAAVSRGSVQATHPWSPMFRHSTLSRLLVHWLSERQHLLGRR